MTTMRFYEGTGWTDLGDKEIDSALADLGNDGRITIKSDTMVPLNPARWTPVRGDWIRTVTGYVANDYFILVRSYGAYKASRPIHQPSSRATEESRLRLTDAELIAIEHGIAAMLSDDAVFGSDVNFGHAATLRGLRDRSK